MWPSVLLGTLLAISAAALASDAVLGAGPMVGARAMRSAVVWVQAKATTIAQLQYWDRRTPAAKGLSPPIRLTAEDQFVGHLRVDGLEPGQTYAYRVLFDGEPASPEGLSFTTQPLWQWRHDAPDFRVGLGSCTYVNDPAYDRPGKPYGGDYDTLRAAAAARPDMFLWLGDNTYAREADFDARWGLADRYRHTRALSDMQPLLRTGHHYAIWDDHDYGPNDANMSYPLKDESLALFRRYWANPSHGLPGLPGVFTQFSFNDADFFLLDGRWYRDADRAPLGDEKSLLGAGQLRWLKNALAASTAPFKIIALGSQALNEGATKEGWHHFPNERDAFVRWLTEARIDGVLFVSGDRHFTALYRWDRDDAYPLHELTCSPLTAGPHRIEAGERQRMQRVVPGTLVEGKRNFCTLDFRGPARGREITLTVFNSKGEAQWQRVLKQSELTFPARR
jgi:alkaline phosphatase D